MRSGTRRLPEATGRSVILISASQHPISRYPIRSAKLPRLPCNGRGQRELTHQVAGTAQRVKGAIYAISTRCQEDNHRRVRHPSW